MHTIFIYLTFCAVSNHFDKHIWLIYRFGFSFSSCCECMLWRRNVYLDRMMLVYWLASAIRHWIIFIWIYYLKWLKHTHTHTHICRHKNVRIEEKRSEKRSSSSDWEKHRKTTKWGGERERGSEERRKWCAIVTDFCVSLHKDHPKTLTMSMKILLQL